MGLLIFNRNVNIVYANCNEYAASIMVIKNSNLGLISQRTNMVYFSSNMYVGL